MPEAIVAQKAPYRVEVEVGKKYYWCACGRSKKQPFCDGSHKEVGMAPLLHEPTTSGTAWFCGCKSSKKRPLCDGTHKTL